MAKKIAVLGSINVDTTYHVQRFPMPGETISAGSKSSAPGGKGANQAVAAARSGAKTWLALTTKVSSCVRPCKKTISIPS